jgi:small subunit ribosomal protein S21
VRVPLVQTKEHQLRVFVRDNNVDQALRVLKKKMQREGVFREMKQRRSYEKPSERKTREKSEAIRRARKAARKQAQREGLIPDTRKKKLLDEQKKVGQRQGQRMSLSNSSSRASRNCVNSFAITQRLLRRI